MAVFQLDQYRVVTDDFGNQVIYVDSDNIRRESHWVNKPTRAGIVEGIVRNYLIANDNVLDRAKILTTLYGHPDFVGVTAKNVVNFFEYAVQKIRRGGTEFSIKQKQSGQDIVKGLVLWNISRSMVNFIVLPF